MIMNNDYYVVLLKKAQAGNEIALNELLTYIRDRLMNRRIGKYISKNRQVDNLCILKGQKKNLRFYIR